MRDQIEIYSDSKYFFQKKNKVQGTCAHWPCSRNCSEAGRGGGG